MTWQSRDCWDANLIFDNPCIWKVLISRGMYLTVQYDIVIGILADRCAVSAREVYIANTARLSGLMRLATELSSRFVTLSFHPSVSSNLSGFDSTSLSARLLNAPISPLC
jgi:hypothetical protein